MPRLDPFPYKIEVVYSGEDRAYVARVPSLRGCSAHGSTPEQAAAEARAAAVAMLQVMLDHGDPIPPPDWAAAPSTRV